MDPVGEWRADFRIASLTSAVVNIARSVWGKRGIKMSNPIDFMPEWDKVDDEIKEPERQSVEEMKRIMLSTALAHNKRIERMERLKTRKRKR